MIKRKSSASSGYKSSGQQVVVWVTLTHLRVLWAKDNHTVAATWKPLQSGWMRNGELLEPRYLSQALGDALREINHRGNSDLIWLLPPELMSLRVGDAPAIEGEQLQKALQLEAERLPPERNEEAVLRISLQPGIGGRRQAILGKVYRSTFNVLNKIAEEHRLRLWDIDQAGLALGIRQGVLQSSKDGLWMLLHLEPGNSNLTFFWRRELVRSRSLVDLLDPWDRQVKGEAGLLEALVSKPSRLESNEVMNRITQAIEETLNRIAQDGFSVELTKAANDQNLSGLYVTGIGALEGHLHDLLIEHYGYLFDIEHIEAPLPAGALYGPMFAALDGQRVSRFSLNRSDAQWSKLQPALTVGLVVAGALLLAGLTYSFSLSSQIVGEEHQVVTLKPEEERQKALQASIRTIEAKLLAAKALEPVDWRRELQPLLSKLPTDGEGLGVGLNRIGLLNTSEAFQYSLEGVAINRFALETFLRSWEQPGHAVVLNRWGKKNRIYEFAASVKSFREGKGE